MAHGAERPTDKSLFWRIVEDRDVRLDAVQRAVLRYLADVGGSATDFELRTCVSHPASRIRGLWARAVMERAVMESKEHLVSAIYNNEDASILSGVTYPVPDEGQSEEDCGGVHAKLESIGCRGSGIGYRVSEKAEGE